VALALFTVVLFLMLALVRSGFGRVLVAIRENEERTRMLGYDTFSSRLAALVVSGTVCAAAGAAYGILFGYVGANFASVQYSILPLLWVLLGGGRHRQRLHLRLHAGGGHRPHPLGAVLPQGAAGHGARALAEVAAMSALPEMSPLLETRALSRDFGGLRAVDRVDFSVDPGEIRAIIGPNGAGKTTFVSLVCGRLAPSSGTIIFDGADITALPAHRRVRLGIAYTFQITSVYAQLSVFDNVALAVQRTLVDGRSQDPSRGRLRTGVTEALERVGLADRASLPAGQLAYGHQRLLEVAMGLALKPRLMILDEPTQGLGDGEIENFVALAREIAANATVLLIEHNMDVVMQLADRITVLEAGRVLAEGTPDAIRANEAVQRAYLGGGA
jgi:branched-chain amino acid transport system ATP-binding protein